jgi:hypothetical protein
LIVIRMGAFSMKALRRASLARSAWSAALRAVMSVCTTMMPPSRVRLSLTSTQRWSDNSDS